MRPLPGLLSSLQQPRRFALWLVLLVITAVGLAALGWWWLRPAVPAPLAPAQWMDEQQCQTCHADTVKAWQGSHHQLAMQPATARTVLGDFSAAPLQNDVESTQFRQAGDEFWINTQGADGQGADFKVA